MRTEGIRTDIVNVNKAVEGILTAKTDDEKNAWIIIYNSRLQSIFGELDGIDKEYEIKQTSESVIPETPISSEEPKKKKK